MELKMIVCAKMGVDGSVSPELERRMLHSAQCAVRNALKQAEDMGFDHPMSDEASLEITGVLNPERIP